MANNTGTLYTSVSPAKIAGEQPMASIVAEDRNIPIPKPLQTNEFFCASIHNSPFKESAMPSNRKSAFVKPYVSVEEVEEPTSVDVGVDCFEATIDDDVEHDVRMNALLSRVDAMVTTERTPAPEPSTSTADRLQNEAQTNKDSTRSTLTADADNEHIIIETEDASLNQFNNTSPIMGNCRCMC